MVALIAVSGMVTVSFASTNEVDPEIESQRGVETMDFEERKEWKEDHIKERRDFSKDRREEVRSALEEGDYEEWQEAVGDNCPLADRIDEDNFSKLKEAENKRAEAASIMEELGIERPGHGPGGFRHAGCQGCHR